MKFEMTGPARLRLLLLPVAMIAGCATFGSTARSHFVREATCPEDRVTVERAPPQPAPREIAADAGRLAVWNANAEQRAKSYYVARGCGQEHLYYCERRYTGDSNNPASWIECDLRR